MQVVYTTQAKEDCEYWKQNSLKTLERIDKIIEDIKKHPFYGIGKPERLKFDRAGYWSRRINRKDRIVYLIKGKTIYITQCRYHYSD